MVISSRLEGGANTVSEAVACGVPVLASRVDGNVGLLGENYPGYFPYGDTVALANLLLHAERDKKFYRSLKPRLDVSPRTEMNSWEKLFLEIQLE